MKKIVVLLLISLLMVTFCACENSVEETECSPLLLHVFTTREADRRSYIYNEDGTLKAETGLFSWQTTEYTYSEEGVLLSHKRAYAYDENLKQVTKYEEVQYDANGLPITIKDANGTWEYAYDYAEKGTILSVDCWYKSIYGETLFQNFDFSSEQEEYYGDYQPLSGSLVLKTVRDNRYVTRYMILNDGKTLGLYEIGNLELDEKGNPIKAIEKGGIMRPDGGWITEYSYENKYDDAKNLIFCKKTNFETNEVTEYYYMYGYYYVD